MSALLGILGVVLDARFGEPQGWHRADQEVCQ